MVLTLAWFKSCITERKKKTLVDGELADFYKFSEWNSSRFYFGPLLFILHMKGLLLCQLYSRPSTYADDITLTSVAEDADTLQVKMNCDLKKLRHGLR